MKILDLPSNTCHSISERRVSDPNGRGPRFNAHWGNILIILCSRSKAYDATIASIVNFEYFLKKHSIKAFPFCDETINNFDLINQHLQCSELI